MTYIQKIIADHIWIIEETPIYISLWGVIKKMNNPCWYLVGEMQRGILFSPTGDYQMLFAFHYEGLREDWYAKIKCVEK